jgi:hypothetical protein
MANRTNAGITGLFGGETSDTALFRFEGVAWGLGHSVQVKSRIGRGTGIYPQVRAILAGGAVNLAGILKGVAFPEPSAFTGQTGSIVFQIDTGRTITVPVTVTSANYDTNKKVQDQIDCTCACAITGPPVFAGFGGSQPAATDTSFADLELYEGKLTTYDPADLQSGGVMNFDVVGTTATDAAEVGKIVALIAATTPPVTGTKWRFGRLVSRDPFGLTISLEAARTTTAEDQINAASYLTTDQSGLETAGNKAAINATPTADSVGGTPLVIRKVTTRRLNDGNVLYVIEEGLESVEDQREREASRATADPQGIADYAAIATIAAEQPAEPTPPAGTVFSHWEKQEQEDGRYLWVAICKGRNSKQEIEFASVVRVDGSTLESRADVIVVQSSDAPSTPATPFTGAVYVDHERRVLTLASGAEKYQYTYHFGYETNAQKLVREVDATTTDPASLEDVRILGVLDSADAPSTPSGLKLIEKTKQLYPNNHYRWAWRYGRKDHADEVTFAGAVELDGSTLDSEAVVIVIQGNTTVSAPAAPFTGAVHVRTTVKQLTDTQWALHYAYAYETTLERLAREASNSNDDPQDLEDATVIGVMDSAIAPATPAGLKLVKSERQDYPNSHYRMVWRYGRKDSKDEVEYGGRIELDPDTLDSQAVLIVVQANQTISAPAAPFTGAVLVRSSIRQLTATKWAVSYTFGYETALEKLAREPGKIETDPKALEDVTIVGVVDSTDAPATPAGLKLVRSTREELPNNHYRLLWRYGRRDAEDEIEFAGQLSLDASTLDSEAVVIVVQGDTTLAAPAAPFTGAVYTRATVKQLTDAKWAVSYHYAYETTIARLEREESHTQSDPNALADLQVLCQIDDATPPATPAGYRLKETRAEDLPNSHTRHVFTFARTDSKDAIEFDSRVDVDLSTLDSSAILIAIQADTTPVWPADPFTDAEPLHYSYRQLTQGKWAVSYHYGYETTIARLARESGSVEDDPQDLNDVTVIGVVDSADAPATPSGLKLVSKERRELANGHYRIAWKFGRRNSADEITFDGRVELDVSTIDSQASVIVIQANQTVSAPSTPFTGGVHVRTLVRQLTDAKWALTYHYAYETAAAKLVREHTRERLDVDGIDSEAVTAAFDGAAPAHGTLLKSYDETISLPNSHYLSKAGHDVWGGSSAKRIAQHTKTRIAQDDYAQWSTAEEVTITGTLESTLETIFASLQNTVDFQDVSGIPISPGKALVIKSYTKADKILLADFRAEHGFRNTRGGQVSVTSARSAGVGNWTYITTQQSMVHRVTGTLVYRRRLTSAAWTTFLHYSSIGLRNSGTLLGINAGYLMYAGPKIRRSEYITGDHVAEVDFILHFDSTGFIEDGLVGIGRFTVDAAITTGYKTPSTIDATWATSAPGSADLSFITA